FQDFLIDFHSLISMILFFDFIPEIIAIFDFGMLKYFEIISINSLFALFSIGGDFTKITKKFSLFFSILDSFELGFTFTEIFISQ
ncbi:MAG: hypothetical protein ACUVUG_09665, partial [Candidatus Aminicenantia bacterium]